MEGKKMKSVKILTIAAVCLLMASAPAFAQNVSLAWDPNREADVAGYKVHYKSANNSSFNGTGAVQGSSPITVGNLTSLQIMGLEENKTWCFAVSAYNTSGEESPLSGEVCTVAGPGSGNRPSGTLTPPKLKRVR
jgi:hypothetical protein